ncbi:shikimate dehydrogenase [Novosphingobium rosa]|uniref:shikimate dehydrogenase n=1 Tax=Novosphingobium rosa TaxID=76978 RepID=UPI000833C12B|nr:shikimate dehydrogenase [Novosphingobium rosa]
MTLPYAEVIGDPIAQSKSPIIHKHWLSALGLQGDYRHAHVTAQALPAYIAARRQDENWRGCNVTMPHKQTVMPLLDALDPLAEQVGAVNTVVRGKDGRLTGYNTDARGSFEPLLPYLVDLPRRIVLLGNGGAARAILAALTGAGQSVTLAARNTEKARALADELAPDAAVTDLARFAQPGVGDVDLLINASPLGMVGNPPLAFDLTHLSEQAVVFDIVTAPLETRLLQAACAAGLVTIDGLAMLIEQAVMAFALFFGELPPRDDGDAALRALLTA